MERLWPWLRLVLRVTTQLSAQGVAGATSKLRCAAVLRHAQICTAVLLALTVWSSAMHAVVARSSGALPAPAGSTALTVAEAIYEETKHRLRHAAAGDLRGDCLLHKRPLKGG
mmetsp:Transcript_109540/g.340036  ORF Transcript_109540/g.340036 Transcript_109540/m.340036 type:complete len:113 (+) Transcript_109540:1094-1432(+)